MAKFQLLQNKAVKLILDKAKHSSVTEAINELDWLVLYLVLYLMHLKLLV